MSLKKINNCVLCGHKSFKKFFEEKNIKLSYSALSIKSVTEIEKKIHSINNKIKVIKLAQ